MGVLNGINVRLSGPPLSTQAIRRLLAALLVLGAVILVVVSLAAAWLVGRDQDFTGWVNHTYVVERHISRFSVLFERAEAARRGYLLTHDDHYLVGYRQAATGLPKELETFQALTADNPREQEAFTELEALLASKLNSLEASIQAAHSQAMAAPTAAATLEQDQPLVDHIRVLLARMVAEENRLLQVRTERQTANAEVLLAVVLISGGLLALLSVGALLLVRRYAADLDRSQGELRHLNDGLEQAVRDRTADLTRANDEIQRFAYIVSHDLRSPLVNVMGFTSELEVSLKPLQQLLAEVEDKAPQIALKAARETVVSDLPEAIGFIRSSTRKMDRLINAILKLSREGRRTLTIEPLDMDALFEGIVGSLKHPAVERGAEVVIESPLPDISGDRLAVEQVFSNLIENALKYGKLGRPGRIVVRGRAIGTACLYEIEDNGRGIAATDHERIFELFRRSGSQDQPGEGIGLAHVRALIYRLGGSITLDSELDRGTTFRVSLPRNLLRERDPSA
jgi:signal transduction histidine kinase